LARRDFSVTVLLNDVEGLRLKREKFHSKQLETKKGNLNIPAHKKFPAIFGLKNVR
jgi:hypothetical protein